MVHKRIILLLLVFVLTGCQSGVSASMLSQDLLGQSTSVPEAPVEEEQPEIEPTETPSEAIEVVPPTEAPTSEPQPLIATAAVPTEQVLGLGNIPADINPLTGLPVSDPEILNRRPVFIKVSNFPGLTSRPQAGLSYADMVFEYYIGEWMNRFLAVFYGQDTEKSWPLRSGRLIDPQLTNMYQGVLVYGNADEKVDEIILKELGDRAISFNNAPCPPICGYETHSASGVYVNSAQVTEFTTRQGVKNARFPLEGMLFKPEAPETQNAATQIDIEFIRWNRSEWHYDTESGKYLRWTELWDKEHREAQDDHPMIPHVEQLTGEQLAFSNIIIVFAYYDEYAATLHDVEIWDTLEKQKAVFYRDGKMYEGYWRAPYHDRPIQFINENGTPMALKPGNTWVMFAGYSSKFSQTEEGHWELLFKLP